jgi:hypothetical protein
MRITLTSHSECHMTDRTIVHVIPTGLRMPANYGDEAAAAADEVADARYKEKMDDRTFSRNPM